jgi:site-specific DNA-cytosine methylase
MGTFAEKPKATQQAMSSKTKVPARSHLRHNHEVNSILHLQRAIGNQAVQRLLQSNAEEHTPMLTGTTSPQFGHDFSRIRLHPPVVTQQPSGFAQSGLFSHAPQPRRLTKREYASYMNAVESQQDAVRSGGQQSHTDFGSMDQKQQQMMQMLSNILKNLYDLLKSIKNKIGV